MGNFIDLTGKIFGRLTVVNLSHKEKKLKSSGSYIFWDCVCECGSINKELTLSDRVWECKSCGQVNERDLLAAKNIKKFALKDFSGQELSEEPVEMSTLVESVKQEAQHIGFAVGG